MPARREGFVDWRKSKAKTVLLGDLLSGLLPLDAEELSAVEAWNNMYIHMPEFVAVNFDQFRDRLRDHRKQIKRRVEASGRQWTAYVHDREKYPEVTHYDNGRRVFRHSPAFRLLEEDVKAGLHRYMTPTALRASREEYMEWDLDVFTQRIYQMQRRFKFINYLEWKRSGEIPLNLGSDEEDDEDDGDGDYLEYDRTDDSDTNEDDSNRDDSSDGSDSNDGDSDSNDGDSDSNDGDSESSDGDASGDLEDRGESPLKRQRRF
jgi:hypothetical protein